MAKKRADGDGGDELLDALYAAPPRAFAAERARVVAALKAAGRGDEARAVAKRKRPSASVWAVNQLARRAADELDELLALGASLRAGERALLGGGDAAGFMEEARTARHKVAALARRAEAIVEESGQKATLALARKIAQTLHAASIGDDATRARLAAGRLEEELAPSAGFGEGGDLSSALAALGAGANAKAKAQAMASARAKSAHAKSARAKSAHAKPAHAKSTATAAQQAAVAAERARGAAERARSAAARARGAAELRAQRRNQAAARKHAAALARAATAAERAVAERARAVERLRAAVERAESDLRAAKDALAAAELAAAAARRAADEAAAAAR